MKPSLIVTVIGVRYIILPIIGIGVVLGAANLGFLPADPLFSFILMIQFTLPPAMNIGTSRFSKVCLNMYPIDEGYLMKVGHDYKTKLSLYIYIYSKIFFNIFYSTKTCMR